MVCGVALIFGFEASSLLRSGRLAVGIGGGVPFVGGTESGLDPVDLLLLLLKPMDRADFLALGGISAF